MLKPIILLSSIVFMITACTRTPVKALEAVVNASADATNSLEPAKSVIDDSVILTSLSDISNLQAPPPSRIPLTIQLASPIDTAISNLEVYLWHTKIQQMIDKQSFDAHSTLIFSPNVNYYIGVYYGDTLEIKYNYHHQPQVIKIPLLDSSNHLTLDFIEQKFQVIDSRYIPPDKNQFISKKDSFHTTSITLKQVIQNY